MSRPVVKLIRQIRAAVAVGGAEASLESLAAEYTRLALGAAQRLESCAAMLEKGSDYQALQLAETEPVLLDLIAALSFAEVPEWLAMCTARQLPCPVKFASAEVQALDRLYAHGITSSHPLYKDYRAAITSRDDTRALALIRSIVRLNAQDTNAQSELARIQNKLFQIRLQDLRTALAGGGEEQTLALVTALEEVATPARLSETPEYAAGAEWRRSVAVQEASARAAKLIRPMSEAREAGEWRSVGGYLAELDDLLAEHAFSLEPEAAKEVMNLRLYYTEKQEAAAAALRFQQALTALQTQSATLETRLLSRSSFTSAEADQALLDYNQQWRKVEKFRQPIADEVVQRVQETATALRTVREQLQRRRRFRSLATALVILAALLSTGWLWHRAQRALDYLRQLTTLQEEGEVDAAEKLIAQVRGSETGLASRPEMQARLESTSDWAQSELLHATVLGKRLASLETLAAAAFQGTGPVPVLQEITATRQDLAALAASLQPSLRPRLEAVSKQFESHVSALHEQLTSEAESEVARLEERAPTGLRFDQTKEELSAAVGELEPALKSLESRTRSPLPALELPGPLQARLSAVRSRLDLFRGELDLLRETQEALLQAATLEAYEKALSGYRVSRLAQVAEVNDARKMLAIFPKLDDVLARLLLPDDPAAWMAAREIKGQGDLMPEKVLPVEMGKLLSLREDNYLAGIWEATLVDPNRRGARRLIYARGEIRKDGPRDTGGGIQATSWSGNFYDPANKAEGVAFLQGNFQMQRSTAGSSGNGEILDEHLSGTSELLARLELNRMTDAAGEKYERPLLRVFDELAHDRTAHPLAKAYLLQQLGALATLRPSEWGLAYSGSLRVDLARLAQLTSAGPLRSMDWLLERKRAELGPPITAFCGELLNRSYLMESRLHRDAVQAALRVGLRFGGFLDATRQPRLLGESASADALWALRPDATVVRLDSKGVVAPFSPVFFLPLNRASFLVEERRRLAAPGTPSLKPPAVPFFE